MNERTYIDPRCTREGWPTNVMADIFDRLRKAAGDLDAHARHVFGDTQNYASLDNVGCYEHEKTCWDAYAEIERLRYSAELDLKARRGLCDDLGRLRAALDSFASAVERFVANTDPRPTVYVLASAARKARAALAGGAIPQDSAAVPQPPAAIPQPAVPASERLTEAEALLRELTDIEGPQPGHVMWARKVWAFLGVPEPSATSENPDAVCDPVAREGHAGVRARQIDDVADDPRAANQPSEGAKP